jgi:hypothetical protein
VISQQPKLKSLFISLRGPDIFASDIEKFYSSSHLTAKEDDYPLLNDSKSWPNCWLIPSFYGRK